MKKFENPVVTVVKFRDDDIVYTISFGDIKKPYETEQVPLDDDLAL